MFPPVGHHTCDQKLFFTNCLNVIHLPHSLHILASFSDSASILDHNCRGREYIAAIYLHTCGMDFSRNWPTFVFSIISACIAQLINHESSGFAFLKIRHLPALWVLSYQQFRCPVTFQRNGNTLNYFCSTPHSRGRVYKWKFSPFVCTFVCMSSLLILFLFFQTLKLRRVTQPLPQYPMSPIHVSHARPHSPVNWSPNEQDHLADLSSPIWFIISAVNIFQG